jgi:inosose dehydratase
MVDIGFEGTELGPPGYLGDAKVVHERLSSRGLELVGAFLPQHLSRNEKVQEDRARLRDSLRLIRDGAPDGSHTFAILCDQFDEPERLAFSGRIAEHPEAWLPANRF